MKRGAMERMAKRGRWGDAEDIRHTGGWIVYEYRRCVPARAASVQVERSRLWFGRDDA